MKIVILTASPTRDKYIDELIADKLRAKGHELWVVPCLRQGRPTILEIQPNVVVLPPIRNPYSRDLAEQIKMWGMGLVTRHTEPSASWADLKKMTPQQQANILGHHRYPADVELVWGQDEAEFLNRRQSGFQAVSVGAVGLDIYFQEDLKKRLFNKPLFNKKYKFSGKKRTLLIASPWGFADSAPDLRIDELTDAKADDKGRDRHLQMVRDLYGAIKDKWNILITIHPGVLEEPYKKLSEELQIPLNAESPMAEMLINCDALIHAGSTAAISAHFLNIPAFQFGDVNAKSSKNWWGLPESNISKVSPYYQTAEELGAAVKKSRRRSNADKVILKALENGRYGKMDGQASDRAADIIDKIRGEFKLCWPISPRDYNQSGIAYKRVEDYFNLAACSVCKKRYYVVRDVKMDNLFCPWCAAKSYTE